MESKAARTQAKDAKQEVTMPNITAADIGESLRKYKSQKYRFQNLSNGILPLSEFYKKVAEQKEALNPEQLCELVQILVWKPEGFDLTKRTKTDNAFQLLQNKFGEGVWKYIAHFRGVRKLTPKDLEEFYKCKQKDELPTLVDGLVKLTKELPPKMDVAGLRNILYAHPETATILSDAIVSLANSDFPFEAIVALVGNNYGKDMELSSLADKISLIKPFVAPLENGNWFLFVQKLSELSSYEDFFDAVQDLAEAFALIGEAVYAKPGSKEEKEENDFQFYNKEFFGCSGRYARLIAGIVRDFPTAIKKAQEFKDIKSNEKKAKLAREEKQKQEKEKEKKSDASQYYSQEAAAKKFASVKDMAASVGGDMRPRR